MYLTKENGYIKASEQKTYDEGLAQCFWVVLDLKEAIEFHAVGRYPLLIAVYADGEAYEIYSCKKGDEMFLCHVIERLQEKVQGKVLIVLEDTEQIGRAARDKLHFLYCKQRGRGEVL